MDPTVKANIPELRNQVDAKQGDKVKDKDLDPELAHQFPTEEETDYLFDDEDDCVEPVDPEAAMPEADDFTPEAFDNFLTAQVLLPQGGEQVRAVVKSRKKDRDGNPVGKRNANPLLDTREYEVEFPDGSVDFFTANTIAENLCSQVDDQGRHHQVLVSIVDHRENGHAVTKEQAEFRSKNGKKHNLGTTRGWDLQVEWRDGSTSWVPLKDSKESNPVEVAEHAASNLIDKEPAFVWWA